MMEDPFAALREIAERSLSNSEDLPAQINIQPHWSGVGFLLDGKRVVASMSEVAEILEVPSVTRLPGVKTWVEGVANVRGRLMPLIDLESFLGGKLTARKTEQRVLAIEIDDVYCGLIVNEVFGMKHFPVDTFSPEPANDNALIRPYLMGSYISHDATWAVFSPAQLAKDAGFLNASIN